jgi:hypothetical protein
MVCCFTPSFSSAFVRGQLAHWYAQCQLPHNEHPFSCTSRSVRVGDSTIEFRGARPGMLSWLCLLLCITRASSRQLVHSSARTSTCEPISAAEDVIEIVSAFSPGDTARLCFEKAGNQCALYTKVVNQCDHLVWCSFEQRVDMHTIATKCACIVCIGRGASFLPVQTWQFLCGGCLTTFRSQCLHNPAVKWTRVITFAVMEFKGCSVLYCQRFRRQCAKPCSEGEDLESATHRCTSHKISFSICNR